MDGAMTTSDKLSNLTIRQAKADDAAAAVPLIYSSGPAAFDWLLQRKRSTAPDFLSYAFKHPRGLFSYTCHLVACIDGKVVGTSTACTLKECKPMMRWTGIDFVRYFGPFAGASVLIRGLRLDRALPPPLPGRLYIGHLGVAPECRSQGIGAALIQSSIERHPEGSTLIPALDVAVTNPRAQALYERLGFRVIVERPSPDPAVPAHRYMEWAK